jgi:hypothetical protein
MLTPPQSCCSAAPCQRTPPCLLSIHMHPLRSAPVLHATPSHHHTPAPGFCVQYFSTSLMKEHLVPAHLLVGPVSCLLSQVVEKPNGIYRGGEAHLSKAPSHSAAFIVSNCHARGQFWFIKARRCLSSGQSQGWGVEPCLAAKGA